MSAPSVITKYIDDGKHRDFHRYHSAAEEPAPFLLAAKSSPRSHPIIIIHRIPIPSIKVIGRLYLPIPSRTLRHLLFSMEPLHGHLPSPGVLLLLVLARLMRPKRRVTAHWHCFLEPGTNFSGWMFSLYQWLALRALPHLSAVATTSPLLAAELQACGCPSSRLVVLPCCLSADHEQSALALPPPVAVEGAPLRVLFIGRLGCFGFKVER